MGLLDRIKYGTSVVMNFIAPDNRSQLEKDLDNTYGNINSLTGDEVVEYALGLKQWFTEHSKQPMPDKTSKEMFLIIRALKDGKPDNIDIKTLETAIQNLESR